jgi:murein DD-endopeptidase MepM/ murein hydrolase activator NlpD
MEPIKAYRSNSMQQSKWRRQRSMIFVDTTRRLILAMRRSRSYLIVLLWLVGLALGAVSCSNGRPVGINTADGIWYTIQPKETLADIAGRYGVDRLMLQRLNDIYSPDDLVPGMNLFIPGVKRLPPVTVTAPTDAPKVAQSPSSAVPTRFVWPAKGRISSGYGKRWGGFHQGIDIAQDEGREVFAVADGTVSFSGHQNGYGNTIIVDHGNGLETLYAHNAKNYAQKGARTRRGDLIALMGTTGRSNGVHLHFEIRKNGQHQNPLRYLPVR